MRGLGREILFPAGQGRGGPFDSGISSATKTGCQNFLHMDRFCPCGSGRLSSMKRKSKFMQALKIFVGEPHIGTTGARDHAAPRSFPGNDASGQLLEDALHFRSAEYWLKLGHATEALEELAALSAGARQQVSVLKLQVAAMRAVRERSPSKD